KRPRSTSRKRESSRREANAEHAGIAEPRFFCALCVLRGCLVVMPAVTPALAAIIFAAGAVSGGFGALLGIGGGVLLVPFLNLVLHLPFTVAAAISLTTVIAT